MNRQGKNYKVNVVMRAATMMYTGKLRDLVKAHTFVINVASRSRMHFIFPFNIVCRTASTPTYLVTQRPNAVSVRQKSAILSCSVAPFFIYVCFRHIATIADLW